MVNMSCGSMYWRRSDNHLAPEYSGVRKTCSPNATGDASGSEIELSSSMSGWLFFDRVVRVLRSSRPRWTQRQQPRGTKAARRRYRPSQINVDSRCRPREHRLWLVSPMKVHPACRGVVPLWPAVRRLLHCMNKGRSKSRT
jgi:hypothetical protein